MDADRRLMKALEAASDALQHLSLTPDLQSLDCTHIDRLLARVVDLPTEGNQRNSRRNLLVIRHWMITEGPGVVLLEVLGQLYWRLGELNSKQFESFKSTLQQQQHYISLIQDAGAVSLIVQRIRNIQRSKADACQDFLCELSDLTGVKGKHCTKSINASVLTRLVESPVSEMDALRSTSSSPFTPQSVQSYGSASSQNSCFEGLIKFVPSSTAWAGDMEQILTEFYIHGICPGRTVATRSNAYVSLLQTADTCLSTRYALLSLAASYICEYLPGQRDTYHQAELYYSTQALKALATQIRNGDCHDGALATGMLLMHHGAINQDNSNLCWSCHANIFDAIPSDLINHLSDPALFIRTQIVLSRTAQTSHQMQSFPIYAFEKQNWLESVTPSEAQEVCGTLGLCPQLLSIISSITLLVTNQSTPNMRMYIQLEENRLQNLKQWSAEQQGPEQEVLLATAECFRLAALMYLRCRLYG